MAAKGMVLFLVLLGHGTHLGAQRAGVSSPARLSPGTHGFTLRHDGRSRSYLVHVPQHAAADGCPPRPDTAQVRHGEAGTPNAGHSATRLVWAPCRGGAEVAHWKLTVAGHGWPGGRSTGLPERLIGPHTSIVRAAEEVWAFVSRFSR